MAARRIYFPSREKLGATEFRVAMQLRRFVICRYYCHISPLRKLLRLWSHKDTGPEEKVGTAE